MKAALIVGAVFAVAVAACAAARAGEEDGPEPRLWQPEQAVAYLLGQPARPRTDDRALGRAGTARLATGSCARCSARITWCSRRRTAPNCVFSPSCSRFSQKAFGRCGVLQGALLTLDRLLRDHPMAVPFYPRAEGGHLLRDEPGRYCLTRAE